MHHIKYFLAILFGFQCLICNGQSTEKSFSEMDQLTMLSKVNEIRTSGCKCGRRFYPPTTPLTWNDTLKRSAAIHADHMAKNKIFKHYSQSGENIGQRVDAVGYPWQYVGENLGFGHKTFDEVLQHWLESRSHCTLIMNGDMSEMAIAKSDVYWVMHTGKKLKQGYIRK